MLFCFDLYVVYKQPLRIAHTVWIMHYFYMSAYRHIRLFSVAYSLSSSFQLSVSLYFLINHVTFTTELIAHTVWILHYFYMSAYRDIRLFSVAYSLSSSFQLSVSLYFLINHVTFTTELIAHTVWILHYFYMSAYRDIRLFSVAYSLSSSTLLSVPFAAREKSSAQLSREGISHKCEERGKLLAS